MVDLRQSPQYANYLKSLGWQVQRYKKTDYALRKIPILGNIIKIQRPVKNINDEDIKIIEKKYKPFQIIIEPQSSISIRTIEHINLLYSQGFKLSKAPYLPTKTIQIKLSKSLTQLLKEMHYKTRYNIKKAKDLKVQIKGSEQIELFIKLYHKWHKKRLLFLTQAAQIRNLYTAFSKNAQISFAYYKNEIVSELLTTDYDSISYYIFAASSNLGKKYFAPTLLTWEAIKKAKMKGCKIFDFEGIYDERFPTPSWKGFSRFKKSFGGKEVKYPGCFIKTRIPI